ncbi:zinc transporter ZIP13 [Trichonephila inaurata madagascariensis]|uniref:Zinc transporter ZIP13 n=1 Tax=Trichonephila inaurata madagascariensis TaxID=2747483 RepID=A0A8X6XZV9_9ARAC|nr:zinc transporter ZIP13 [Trichonephila inaurata madagascariensis]
MTHLDVQGRAYFAARMESCRFRKTCLASSRMSAARGQRKNEFGLSGGSKLLRLLLSFAVGGLLGDVFLHLLPEAWNHIESFGPEMHSRHLTLGMWVLLGMFSFVILEIMFAASQEKKEEVQVNNNTHNADRNLYDEKEINNAKFICNGNSAYHETYAKSSQKLTQNGFANHSASKTCVLKDIKVLPSIHITGYLNLMANSIDNFTHGLAVAGSFLVGIKMGMLTTFAILIHEIPHEIGDFAILLKSGFNPWNAAKAQVSTATIGILGAVVALSSNSADKLSDCTSWILPFTSGGFLNIALVNVLPDILKEKDPWESMKQMLCLCGGIGVMALVNVLTH